MNHEQNKRTLFWNNLEKTLRAIPKRSQSIVGIDANGHITSQTSINNENNASKLARLLHDTHYTATNSWEKCNNTAPTYQSRDGQRTSTIDYILIPKNQANNVTYNQGTMEHFKRWKDNYEGDHSPVMLQIKLKCIPAENKKYRHQVNINKAFFQAVYTEIEKEEQNKMREHQQEVDPSLLNIAHQMQADVAKALEDIKDIQHTATEAVENIDRIIMEISLKHQPPKKTNHRQQTNKSEKSRFAINNNETGPKHREANT
jgi:hypothetical protein